MPDARNATAFERSDYVEQYEDWYTSPFGRLVDRVERRMIDELLAPLAPGASLLEIGCGTAHFGVDLAARGWNVVGCDPSHAMLVAAARRAPPLRAVARGDGLRLPFVDGAFDAALIAAVIEFVADPVALIAEARRVARERVVVVTVARASYLGLRRRVSGRLGHPVFSKARYLSRRELIAIAERAGSRVERTASGVHFPPALAGCCARLEERLARHSLPGGGIIGFALTGSRRT